MMNNEKETEIRKGISNGLMGSVNGEEFSYDQETSRLLNLLDTCEDVSTFMHGGRIYIGNKTDIVRAYIKNNPVPSGFSVWLQKNCTRLTRTNK